MGRIIQSLVEEKYKYYITNSRDLIGDDPPSKWFSFMTRLFGYLLDDEVKNTISQKGIQRRKIINPIIKKFGKYFLNSPQVIEDSNKLLDFNYICKGKKILPKEPVIWVANHAFKDDALATVLAAKRHGYMLFGSLPQFYNTPDGITSWMNGIVMINRKNKNSRKASLKKCIEVINQGGDLIIFPEGVLNKSPNQLVLDLWPGVYEVAKSTGAKVIPIIHYLRDMKAIEKHNPIHTIVGEPITISNLQKEDALMLIRDYFATGVWLLMEKYGQSTRNQVLDGKTFNEYWEKELIGRVNTIERYDSEIELTADFRPREKVRIEDVWMSISQIKTINKYNVFFIDYAKSIVEREKQRDYQRRF